MDWLIYCLMVCVLISGSWSMHQQEQHPVRVSNSLDVPGENPFVFCDEPGDYLAIVDHVDLDPNPPKAGDKLTIVANGTLKGDVKNGSKIILEVKIRVGGTTIPLAKEERDLCDLLEDEDEDEQCPVRKGDVELTRNVTLPNGVPKGTYLVRANAYDDGNCTITCMEATVDF